MKFLRQKIHKYIRKKKNIQKNRLSRGIICYAVGGPQNYRNLRALLLNQCVEKMGLNILGSLTLPTKDIGPQWNIPAIPMLKVMGDAIPISDSAIPEQSQINCITGDIVLIIGKTNIGFGYNNDSTEFLSQLQGVKVQIYVMGGSQGDFNFDDQDVAMLLQKGFKVNKILSSECPVLSHKDWNTIFQNKYPPILNSLRAIAIGGFFSSRIPQLIRKNSNDSYITDAFSRQFGLEQICQNGPEALIQFESQVSKSLSKKCCSENTKKIYNLIKKIKISSNKNADTNMKHVFQKSFKAYELNPLSFEENLHLTNILEPYLNNPKEYDGYTAYCMIRNVIGKNPPSQVELLTAIIQGVPTDECIMFKKKVKRVHVIHDLGLDPQSDDFNAISLLSSMYCNQKFKDI